MMLSYICYVNAQQKNNVIWYGYYLNTKKYIRRFKYHQNHDNRVRVQGQANAYLKPKFDILISLEAIPD